MNNTTKRGRGDFPIQGAMYAVGTLIFGSMTADALEGNALFSLWYKPLEEYRIAILAVVIGLFLCSFYKLYSHRSQFQAVRSLFQEECTEPHDCLLIFMSSPFGRHKEPIFTDSPFSIRVADKTLPATGSLEGDIGYLDQLHWSWQQMLRGIRPHAKELKAAYIIGSLDSEEYKGSFSAIHYAGELIQYYIPKVAIHLHPEPVDFENFNDMKKSLHAGIELLKKQGFREEDMIIDVTGGQKTTSIAGAAVTLYSKVTFQYVQPGKPYKVIKYDVEIQTPATI